MALSSSGIAEIIRAEDPVIYNNLAASTFFFWDYCLTFGQEVELIWRSKWSPVKLLFYAVRYVTLVIRIVELVFYANISGFIRPSALACMAWVWFEVISGHVVFIGVEILLIMRMYAFYGGNKYLLSALFIVLILQHAASIFIMVMTVPKIVVIPTPLPSHLHSGACLVVSIPNLFFHYWVPGLIFESILFVLLVAKFIGTKWKIGTYTPHLLAVFIRDGAWAFMLIFAAFLWCTLEFQLSLQKGDVPLTWIYSILGFSGSHLVLNLRVAAQERTHWQPTQDDGAELKVLTPVSVCCPTEQLIKSHGSAAEWEPLRRE